MKKDLTFLNEKGFDTTLGISFLGDESMYNEILLDFKNGFVDQMNAIKTSYDNKDFNNYTILVHALKSNCKTLGITSLASIAYEHEMKGKANDINYISEHISELLAKANEIFYIMKEYFGE